MLLTLHRWHSPCLCSLHCRIFVCMSFHGVQPKISRIFASFFMFVGVPSTRSKVAFAWTHNLVASILCCIIILDLCPLLTMRAARVMAFALLLVQRTCCHMFVWWRLPTWISRSSRSLTCFASSILWIQYHSSCLSVHLPPARR